MKRLLLVLGILFGAIGFHAPHATAYSTWCSDANPPGEINVPIVDAGGVYLAATVWPFVDHQVVALCYRLPGVAGGSILVDVYDNTTPAASASVACFSDGGYPINCSGLLAAAGITVGNPVSNTVSVGSGAPCIIGGICVPTLAGQIALVPAVSSISVYLPVVGTVYQPVTFPVSGCIINFSGPC